MPKRVIDFHDSVEFKGDWEFVKSKKEKIVVTSEKKINSQIYMTFNEVIPLYTFLYFALAPEEAFGFQKVQSIFDKMKGETAESKQQFEECKRALCLNWNGVTPLSELIGQNKKRIIREQKSIYNISARIEEEEIKQLIKSGLSQRKIHLDFHTCDGQQQQPIIPTVQNIDNFVSVIHNEKNHKYLLAFFCHIDEEQKLAKQNVMEEVHIKENSRALPNKPFVNPDDRPLPPPPKEFYHHHQAHQQSFSNQRQPNFERNILHPDEKLLCPPEDKTRHFGDSRTSLKNVYNPDDRLLVPPPKQNPKDKKLLSSSKISAKSTTSKNANKENEIKKEIKHLGEVAGEKMHLLGEKALHLAEKVEEKVEEIVDNIKHDDHDWVQWGVGLAIIGMAVKTLGQ